MSDTTHPALAAAQAEFTATVAYLNTASYGLPPRRVRSGLTEAQALPCG